MEKEQEIHFICAINTKESTDKKLNIVFLAIYEQMPNAWEFWKFYQMLSEKEEYKDIMADILLIPISESLCRTDIEIEEFNKMKKIYFEKTKQ